MMAKPMLARVVVALTVVALLSVAVLPKRALAQAPAPQSSSAPATGNDGAATLKKRGDDAVAQLRYADAIAAYDASYALDPNPAVLFNKGRALQGLGRYGEALATFERFKKDAPADLLAKVPGLDGLIMDMRARVTVVTLRCSIAGARVVLGDRVLGTTPLARSIAVNAERTSLEVTADGYLPVTRQLELTGGTSLVVDIALIARDRAGVLTVRSAVPGAHVFVDGTPLGASPAEAPLEAGTHTVRVQAKGYDDVQTTVVLGTGEHKELPLDPTKPPGILSKWWFWTGVGVVLAGAVVTTIALTTEKAPGTGDAFQPGKVSGPLIARW
jgi:hypothetical protein